jgi:hypothetical protein
MRRLHQLPTAKCAHLSQATGDRATSRYELLDVRFSKKGEDEPCLTITPVRLLDSAAETHALISPICMLWLHRSVCFSKPSNANKSILVMNVHPSAIVTPPGPITAEPFAPEALYELKIDTNGDAVADTYRVRFSASEERSQTAMLRRVEGAQAAGTGDGGQVIVEKAQVSTGRDARVREAGEYRFFAGWRSDPFFFDTQGNLNNRQFTSDDFFADKNVCSIVWEVPNTDLGTKRVGLWARTLIGADGTWVQADRDALPAQAVFLVGTERDAYLAGEAVDDDRIVPVFFRRPLGD